MIHNDLRNCLVRTIDTIECNYRRSNKTIMSGIKAIDRECGGLSSGDIVVLLYDSSSVGVDIIAKTVLNTASKYHAVTSENSENEGMEIEQHFEGVTYWSLCDDIYTITLRLISAASGIPVARLDSGQLNDEDWNVFASACGKVSDDQITTVIDNQVQFEVAIDEIVRTNNVGSAYRRLVLIDSVSTVRSIYSTQPLLSIMASISRVSRKIKSPIILVHSLPWMNSEQYLTLEEQILIRGMCKYIGFIESRSFYSSDDITDTASINWYR